MSGIIRIVDQIESDDCNNIETVAKQKKSKKNKVKQKNNLNNEEIVIVKNGLYLVEKKYIYIVRDIR